MRTPIAFGGSAPASDRPSIVYLMPDKLGGMFTAIANLVEHRPRRAFGCHVVLTHHRRSTEPRSMQPLAADTCRTVEHDLPAENLWSVIRRVARAIPAGPGVIVTGDPLDLAAVSAHDFGRAVVFVLHGSIDYYFKLAVRHETAIHAFVACSAHIAKELRTRLPHRAAEIYHIPHGVPPTDAVRRPVSGALRVAFVGRIHTNKGVLDLPQIEAALTARDVEVAWTLIGDGPLTVQLRNRWPPSDRVRYVGMLSSGDVQKALADQDVLVLPTRSEGFSVVLLEAMNAGVVPIVSDIPSGVPEVIRAGVNGFTPRPGDIEGFAAAITRLDADRPLLEACSTNARDTVATRFGIDDCVARHYALFSRYRELYRPLGDAAATVSGSRLDRSWLPNAAVYAVRRSYQWLQKIRSQQTRSHRVSAPF